MQLLGVTDERKALLEGAEHVHQFVRDVDETDDRMSDKVHMYIHKLMYRVLYVLLIKSQRRILFSAKQTTYIIHLCTYLRR